MSKIKRIEYNRELLEKRIKLERKLASTIEEVRKQEKACEHLPVLVYPSDIRCLYCGATLKEAKDYIDATDKKTISSNEDYGKITKNRLHYAQNLAIDLFEDDEDIPSIRIISIINEKIKEEKPKQKIKANKRGN